MKRLMSKPKVRITNATDALHSLTADDRFESLFSAGKKCLQNRYPDHKQAGEYFYDAALAGHAPSQLALGKLLTAQKVSRHKYGTPLSWYRAAGAAGIAEALCAVAQAYANGEGVEVDFPRALELYNQSAMRGFAQAQFELGLFYKTGRGLTVDLKKATRWFCQAAKQGHEEARGELEHLYLLKLIRVHEMEAEDRWFVESICSEDRAVWVSLGLSYLRGEKLPRVDNEAVRWLCKAAEDGSGRALFNLAMMRMEGIALAPDADRGLQLMKASALSGYEPALSWLRARNLTCE